MCGIVGIAALPGRAPPDAWRLDAMCATLVHRGPDEGGHHLDGAVGLGARRLAIIDPAHGHQPIRNEDGSVRAVFNGEVYNYRALGRGLRSAGHELRSAADGEVLVHLLEEHGPGFVSRLDGMFAMALHDARRRRLWLIRDRLGIKPLFYVRTADHLVFASEIKAILASELAERRLDVDALGQFLSWEYVPAPRTLFAGIRKLPAAHLLELDLASGEMAVRPYWRLPVRGEAEPASLPSSDEEWLEAIDERVRRAVRRQMISDVPLGALLSGGVDSSLVVSAMAESRAFTIGFKDASYDESAHARRVARHLGLRHHVETLEPDAAELFDRLMGFLEDPIADFSIFPTYLVSQAARRRVKVVLSGDGGDELFGGYETYLAEELARWWGRVPRIAGAAAEALLRRLPPRPAKKGPINKAKRFIEGLKHDPRLGHARWRLFAGEALRRELFTPEAAAELETGVGDHILRLAEDAGPGATEIDRALSVDLRSYLVDNCLVKIDRMSMACSLETRVPLLDHELVELACHLPARLKVHRGRTKILLKRIAARHVPRDCVYRPKEGFSIPIKAWLGGPLRPLMEDLLAPARLDSEGLFRTAAVERLKREHLAGRANHSHVLWALMVFQDWRRRWRA